jgi:hypothetical protein
MSDSEDEGGKLHILHFKTLYSMLIAFWGSVYTTVCVCNEQHSALDVQILLTFLIPWFNSDVKFGCIIQDCFLESKSD